MVRIQGSVGPKTAIVVCSHSGSSPAAEAGEGRRSSCGAVLEVDSILPLIEALKD